MPARVRCEDSASEHLTPPLICLAQAMPRGQDRRRPHPGDIISGERKGMNYARIGLSARLGSEAEK